MAALEPGAVFPRIDLETESGARFVPPDAEIVYAFFKTTCPTSELTLPYLDRIRRVGDGLPMFAVSQDDREETGAFHARLGVSLETLYDPEPWPASQALGLTNVPTVFLVSAQGRIRDTIVGFQRPKVEGLARRATKLAGRSSARIFRVGERVPFLVPG